MFLGWNVWQSYSARMEPPKINASFVPVPVQVGDKTIMVGLAVVEWQVPPEMDAMMVKLAKAKVEAETKALKDAAATNAAGTNAPGTNTPGTNAPGTNAPGTKR